MKKFKKLICMYNFMNINYTLFKILRMTRLALFMVLAGVIQVHAVNSDSRFNPPDFTDEGATSEAVIMEDGNGPGGVTIYSGDNSESQQQVVRGKVSDTGGLPLPGVTVLIKGTTQGTVTDSNGEYSITNVPATAVLVFSFVGMHTQEVAVNNQTVINVTMEVEAIGIEEIVTVGYAKVKKGTLTGSVSAIKGEEISSMPVPYVQNTMAGKIPGVIMRTDTQQPGYDDPYIYVRGIGTTGNTSPLIVIDGIIRSNMKQVDPSSIESITVLKDASAVAPFGLAGANGVILITTKKGQEGFPTLTANSYYGWQSPTYFPDLLDAVDYMKLRNEAYFNEQPGGVNPPYAADLIADYPDLHREDPDRYPDSDTKEYIDMIAPIHKHNLELSGGTAKAQYYAGLGYFKQEGMFEETNYRRINYNVNLDMNVTNTTKVSLSLLGSIERINDLDPSGNSTRLFRGLFKFIPHEPLTFTNGLWGLSAGNAPLGVINSDSYEINDFNTALNTVTVEQQLPFIKGLSVKGSFSYDNRNEFVKGWHEPWYYYIQDTSEKPYTYSRSTAGIEGNTNYTYLRQTQNDTKIFTYQGFVNYQRTFGKHDITGLFVAEYRNNDYRTFFAQRNNFAILVDEFNMGSSNKIDYDNGGSSSEGAQIGYVYRLSYVFNNRFMLETAGRYDGHYYFAPGKRWGYFPSVSVGWRLSEEDFIKDLGYINNLKIRGSWGKSGNLAGSAYQYLYGYTLAGSRYAFGSGSMVQSAYTAQEPNPNITWEKSSKYNFGLEVELWNSLLMLEADYFFEKREGMLLSPAVTVPYEYGLTLAQENAGIMDNRGFEISAGSRHQFNNGLILDLTGNISYAHNKMVEVFETDATYNNPNRRRTGRAYETLFGYRSLGLFTTEDDTNGDGKINSADGYNITQFGTVGPGDIKYADLSGPDGTPDGKIDNHDEVVIGHPVYPRMTFGLTPSAKWKGFDLSLFFQGSAIVSRDIGNFYTVAFENNKSNTSYEYYNNHWTPDNENAKYPKANTSPSSNNTQLSDFWIVNTSHLRLKTAVLGYTLPASITQFLTLKNIRVYCSGQNLFTLSNLKHTDPENSEFGSRSTVAYPNMKTITFGASVTF